MTRRICRSRHDEDGAIAILVALLSVVLFGFGALVIDIGHAQVVRSQAQSTVDAASLAGVRVLANGGTISQVVTTVQSYVDDNMGIKPTQWGKCSDPGALTPADSDPTDTCISTSTSPTPGITSFQVRVKLPTQNVPATFGGLFGVGSIPIAPIAQALSGQPLPPECGPCDPALDETTGQPTPQPPPAGLPAAIRAMMPDLTRQPGDPGYVPPAGPLDPLGSGCPTTPGLFTQASFPTGVTIAPDTDPDVVCTLSPGLYVFDDVNLTVAATGSVRSYPADGSGALPVNAGVTLVFYGSATLTVAGHIGTLLSAGSSDRQPLIASYPDVAWQPGQPIPGVAIVFDQSGGTPPVARQPFTLGDDFDITGSVYAVDGQTTWATAKGDCMPVTSTCAIHDLPGGQSVLATTATAFSPDPDGANRIPTVATDHPMAEPPPSPPHLVK